MKTNLSQRTGFSLFEVIVYLAIVGVVITAVLSVATQSILNRIKAEALHSVTATTRFAIERMTQDVRAATEIDAADLASNVLTITLADGTIRQYQVTADQLTVSTNGAAALALTPTTVNITEFTLTDRTSFGSDVNAVGITLAVENDAANPRPEYQAEFSLSTTVSTRL
ncbi:MAG: type II secretion system protein [Candidatus Kerfeldbacteria bacterium]|nr:type II secretion system protein [Candidatus Kerfeldbacteria bacterium]